MTSAARPDAASGDGCHLPAGSTATGPYALDITPERAGWEYSALRVVEVGTGGSHSFGTGDGEWIVLPLNGGCTVTVTATGPDRSTARGTDASGLPGGARDGGPGPGGQTGGSGACFTLHGRESVFSGVTDFAYAPRDAQVTVSSANGGRFALAGARCERRLPARYGPAQDVPVELRGTGNCSRQVNNFGAAGVFEADRLIAVEVLTPGGNWSSYPPHKHDECRPGEESELEEIYYFEIAPHTHGSGTTEGLGYQRVSPSGHGKGTDLLAEVRSGDTVLIPDGWHGPSMAVPGHDMYYLNVMAGPGVERAWLICDHPDHAWIRGSWQGRPVDPRLPLHQAPTAEGEADR